MAEAGSEGSPTIPSTPTSNENHHHNNERSYSRSPSISSFREFQWTSLLVSSKPGKKKSKTVNGEWLLLLTFKCISEDV